MLASIAARNATLIPSGVRTKAASHATVCKDSANRTKNQIYLNFSEMQPIFETSLKDSANLSRIQIFEIISSMDSLFLLR